MKASRFVHCTLCVYVNVHSRLFKSLGGLGCAERLPFTEFLSFFDLASQPNQSGKIGREPLVLYRE